jgi:hypothetical protein
MTENVPVKIEEAGFRIIDKDAQEVLSAADPVRVAAAVRAEVERTVAEMRAALEAAGGVLSPADTFRVQRYLQEVSEKLAEYERVFKGVRGHIKLLVAEVLADAVGEQDGIPAEGLTVPDRDGDIRISLDTTREHTISEEMLLPAFASMFAEQHAEAIMRAYDQVATRTTNGPEDERARVGVAVAEAIVDALSNVGQLGKFEPQVTKVRAYAKDLARNGEDRAASIVAAAITTKTTYNGVKVERKAN